MSPLLVSAFRRMAWYALGLALALVLIFKVLPTFGVLGPSAEDHVGWAAQALETARVYGADPQQPAFASAQTGLDQARRLLAAGHGREARSAALHARALAIEAQRAALAARADDRRHASRIVDEIDGMLNELEDMYSDIVPKLDKDRASEMLSLMKGARQAGAGLFVAFEQQSYRRVIDDEPEVKAHLAEVKATLEAARRQR
jgi:hypothetical protein